MPVTSPDRIPVIVGIGEIKDRPADPALGLEPVALMEQALRRAEADAGAGLLGRLDALDIVNSVSWPYADLPAALCGRLGGAPRYLNYVDKQIVQPGKSTPDGPAVAALTLACAAGVAAFKPEDFKVRLIKGEDRQFWGSA